MHGTNKTYLHCSIVCTNRTLGSPNTGSVGIYSSDLKLNRASVLSAISNANNTKNLFFNVYTGYGGMTLYGDGVHNNQPAIMDKSSSRDSKVCVYEDK